MIATDTNILNAIENGAIQITPFNPTQLGSNSYDLTLASEFMVYKPEKRSVMQRIRDLVSNSIPKPFISKLADLLLFRDTIMLDSRQKNETQSFVIPETGYWLMPNTLYLASTNERTYTKDCVGIIEGKSSIARLGMNIHQTAGYGDVGFNGTWTLEITVAYPTKVYPNMKIAQISFNSTDGSCTVPYGVKKGAKYQDQNTVTASKNHENFQ